MSPNPNRLKNLEANLSLDRKATGPALEALCAELMVIGASHPGFEVKTPFHDDNRSAKIELIKRKGIRRNAALLGRIATLNEVHDDLRTDIPTLVAGRRIVFSEVEVDSGSATGETFFAIYPDSDGQHALRGEQKDIWQTYQDLIGDTIGDDENTPRLDWQIYSPELKLAYADPTVPADVIQQAREAIESCAPLSVILKPALQDPYDIARAA